MVPDAESNLTMICTTYLSFNTFESCPCLTYVEFEARLQQNPLCDYAARNWGYHVRAAVTESNQLILDLLETDAKVDALGQVQMAFKDYMEYSHYGPKQITALHLARYFEVNEAASTFLRHGRNPDFKDSYGQMPLSWAAQNRQDGVKLLLETGKVNADPKDTRFAKTRLPDNCFYEYAADHWVHHAREAYHVVNDLTARSLRGPALVSTVQVLVAQQFPFGTFNIPKGIKGLHIAAYLGMNEEVMGFLRVTACPDVADSYGQTALHWAVRNGQQQTVELLLNEGLDINTNDTEMKSALHYAASQNNKILIRLFLKYGAETEARRYSCLL